MKKTGYNQFAIKVQGANEKGYEFSERLNKWAKDHKYMPTLTNATASRNGRQTLNFSWYIPNEN